MVAGIEQIFSFPSFDQTFDICQLRALVCVCSVHAIELVWFMISIKKLEAYLIFICWFSRS